jgi:cell division protein FtsB
VTDIVDRLLAEIRNRPFHRAFNLIGEAAAEIERLRDENENLRELLRGVGANRYWEGRWLAAERESERLLAVIVRALAIADEVSRENVELRAEVNRLRAENEMLRKGRPRGVD